MKDRAPIAVGVSQAALRRMERILRELPAEVDGVYFDDWFLSRKYLTYLCSWLKYKLQLKEKK